MIEIQGLNVIYNNDYQALANVSITLEEGNIIGVIGPNGAGKSTFMKALLGLVSCTGMITISHERVNSLRGKVAYVEQKSHVDYHFPITVKECVSLGTYQRVGLFRHLSKKEWGKVENVLRQVKLEEFSNHPISTLSGGQFQRMLIAQCLIQEQDILFLDEPFVGIDLVSEQIIMNLLQSLRREGKTIVIVHHDLSKVADYFDKVVILNKKLVGYGNVATAFTPDALKKAYGDSIVVFMEFINDLMTYHFLQNALITAVVIGIVSGAIGCFIILRSMSLMGDAISHAVLPGVAISFILGINFFIGAVIFGILASFIITFIKENSVIKGDTAIGITISSLQDLGVTLIRVANSSTDLFHILFGNLLAVQDSDKWVTIVISGIVIGFLLIFFKELLVTSFDPILAESMGMNVKFFHYLLMVLLTLVSVTAMQSVGTILIVAMLITPAATAYLYVNSLKVMVLLSSGIGAITSIVGLFLGYTFNIAVGSSIVLTSAFIFLVSFFISPKQSFMK